MSAADRRGQIYSASALQIPGVLDDVYREPGPLGVVLDAGRPTLRVWAPTARSLRLHLFDGPRTPGTEVREMARDERTGTWSAAGEPGWLGKYYLYEVEVFAPATGRAACTG